MAMRIETEFQSNIITLHFESTGNRIRLTKKETREFDERMQQVKDERDAEGAKQ